MPRLSSSGGQLFDLSELAARQSFMLMNMRSDCEPIDTTNDEVFPVPLITNDRLPRVIALLERTAETGAARYENSGDHMALDVLGVLAAVDAARLLLDLRYLDAYLPERILAEHAARLGVPTNQDRLVDWLGQHGVAPW